eukprot:CAMPEP_0201282934 /NCGR_PEP_ID=MMETSP1317-20130820/7062_1 /ASSEMBLY_ACC=CAM_ASM_000770 /TAXON_ID=187299 /ORGANISM="Undescribed Undescribed, Strain Undescribed" /LENGTH=123 /DNA_ID=CAMNT_0047597299 /DNA_START=226 /DNA_END=597 /DNA_ORIENTATION=-
MYKHLTGHDPSITNIARLLALTLYMRRFFPYYAFVILGGLDEHNESIVYSYDVIGSHHPEKYAVLGTSGEMMMPVLDTILSGSNLKYPLCLDEEGYYVGDMVELIKKLYERAAERDVLLGDSV